MINFCTKTNRILLGLLSALFLLALTANPVFAQIYQVINSDGSISYTDQPPLDEPAEEVQLSPTIIQPAVNIPTARANSSAQNTASTANKTIRINSPLNESVLHGSDNQVVVSVSVTPGIENGEQLQLLHNGQKFGAPQLTGQWNLTRLNPGPQNIVVQLVNEFGQVLSQSAPLTLYVIL